MIVPASLGAAGAGIVVALAALAVRRPLARVPENTLKFSVGVLLASFGAFWIGEGLGFQWPGADLSIVGLAAVVLVTCLLAIAVVRRTAEAKTAPAGDPSRPAAAELRCPERDSGGGDVAVPVARHRPHHEGFVGDRPQEAIRGVRRVTVRVPIVRGARVDRVRDLVRKIELCGGRLRADAKLHVHVRGPARVPARIDRSEPDGAGGVRELRARRNVLSSTGSTCRGAMAAPS